MPSAENTPCYLRVQWELIWMLYKWLTLAFVCADKPIIHRDVKSSNILLTGKFRAKVADFGFSHVGPSTDVGITHVSTQVKGTLGYLDPEYLTTNQLTTKSDVYSFGILLVEIFTGRNPIELKRPSDERVTFRWVSTQFILCLVYLLDSFINVVGKVGITNGLNRKRRILIQHQIKLGTFCIWLAQEDLFMRVLSSKLICVCSTKEIDPRLDCFVGIQEFCGGESDWHFGSQYREDTRNTRCYGAFSSIIFCLFSTIKEGSAKYEKVSRSFVEYQKRLSSKKAR